jgi:seryl-tRNA synthetase
MNNSDTALQSGLSQTEADFHSISLPNAIPAELVEEFLAKLHYISPSLREFSLTPERNAVRFRCPSNGAQVETIAERIIESANKLLTRFRPQAARILVSRTHPFAFKEDPQLLLEATGDLIRFGPGRVGFGPRLLRLIEFFEGATRQLASEFTSESHSFPSLIGADALEKCKYLRSFPHTLSLVSHLEEDLRAIQDFARTVRWEENKLVHDGALAPTKCLLAPTVCFHCYAWLQNTRQTAPRCVTAIGKCFRYESGNLGGLERLWDFTMREIVFFGSADYVLEQRQKAIDATVKLLDEWRLAYEIRNATDAFFIDEYSIASFQSAFDLKYEIQATLPYKDKRIAVGSFNYHQDLFGRSFNISGADGQALETGCVGFGLERLALGFLAQHGLDEKAWPVAVADSISNS